MTRPQSRPQVAGRGARTQTSGHGRQAALLCFSVRGRCCRQSGRGLAQHRPPCCTWDSLEELIDNQLSEVYDLSDPLSEDDEVMLTSDGIRAHITCLNTVFEPPIFSAVLIDQALISKVSMAMESMTVDDAACGVFEARVFSSVVDPMIPGHGQTMPRSVSFTRQHHLNVAREPSGLS